MPPVPYLRALDLCRAKTERTFTLVRPEIPIPEDRAVPGDHYPRMASEIHGEHGGKENSPLAKKQVDQAVPVPLSTGRSALLPRVTASDADEDASSQRADRVWGGRHDVFLAEEETGINPDKRNVLDGSAGEVRKKPGNEVGSGSPARLKSLGQRKSKTQARPSDNIHPVTTVLREANQFSTAGGSEGWQEVFPVDAETGYTPDGRASSRKASDVRVKEEAVVDGGEVEFAVEAVPKLEVGPSQRTKRPAGGKIVSSNRMMPACTSNAPMADCGWQ